MLRRSFAVSRAIHVAVLAPLAALALLAPKAAHATDVSIKLEPGVAIPLTSPQSDIYGIGGAQSLKVLFGLTRWLDIGPAGSFLLLPNNTAGSDSGIAWGVGGGLRLKRPHDAVSAFGISPWIDGDLLYVRTGPLDRAGVDIGAGFSIPIGEQRTFWLGPFARYMQTVQPNRGDLFDNRDARVLILGLSFEVGTGIERKPVPPEVRIVTKDRLVVQEHTTEVTKQVEVPVCADRDKDGLPDNVDRCPDVAGPIDTWGCPKYEKVVVGKDKLELKEKIQFAWDKAKLEAVSVPILTEVVHALTDNKNFHVSIEGHTSSEGKEEHNQALSEQRAQAVLDFLVAHGVTKDRLASKGFSSSVPIDTNKTSAGRENNRRVEFVLSLTLSNPGSPQ